MTPPTDPTDRATYMLRLCARATLKRLEAKEPDVKTVAESMRQTAELALADLAGVNQVEQALSLPSINADRSATGAGV